MTQIHASSLRRDDPDPIDEEPGRDDLPADLLDDEADRDELRRRYYGLLQELRVLLPGVQILVAFLLTVPFASGFGRLDAVGRDLFLLSLVAGMLSIIAFLTPTAFHRVGPRQSRSRRLIWGIRSLCLGLVCLAVSLLTALLVVVRAVASPPVTAALVALVGGVMVVLWVVLPRFAGDR